MPPSISIPLIIEAILSGIEDAQKQYKKWSGGEWLAYTAEHVITGFVAKRIWEIPGPKYLEIEPKCGETIKQSCVKRRGGLAQALRPDGHVDMCLWWAKSDPRAIIEIKHNAYSYVVQCDKDIQRIDSSLKRNTTLSFGIFAFYSSADDSKNGKIKAKVRLNKRFDTIESRIIEKYGKRLKIKSERRVHKVGGSAWGADCILIKRLK
ncbi:MAG: hypothetical protein PHR56_02495 [Dehalococcoidales bacterium]|nr:hypothetical protein [Dehalococcoidales bacterium]